MTSIHGLYRCWCKSVHRKSVESFILISGGAGQMEQRLGTNFAGSQLQFDTSCHKISPGCAWCKGWEMTLSLVSGLVGSIPPPHYLLLRTSSLSSCCVTKVNVTRAQTELGRERWWPEKNATKSPNTKNLYLTFDQTERCQNLHFHSNTLPPVKHSQQRKVQDPYMADNK